MYHHLERCTAPPLGVPWTVIWVLSRYHNKFQFSGQMPSYETYCEDLKSATNQLLWKAKFAHNPQPIPSIRTAGPKLTGAPALVPPEIRVWERSFAADIDMSVKTALASGRVKRQENICNLAKIGLRTMKKCGLVIVPNDKGGGYSLRSREDHIQVLEEVMRLPMYQEVHPSVLNTACFQVARRIAEAIQKWEDEPGLAVAIRKPMRIKDVRLCSTLMLTCKNDKVPVTHRNIHAHTRHPFSGISNWVSREIRNRGCLPACHRELDGAPSTTGISCTF
jgi:hypothetical protein